MSKKLKVFWTENAISDLLAIKEYIAQDSPANASTWITELYLAGQTLADFPERGRVVPEFDKKDIRELLIENYRLVYRVGKSKVEILTVFEGHRKLSQEYGGE